MISSENHNLYIKSDNVLYLNIDFVIPFILTLKKVNSSCSIGLHFGHAVHFGHPDEVTHHPLRFFHNLAK